MFWIGLIVGIVVDVAMVHLYARLVAKFSGYSWDEWKETAGLVVDAGCNRESTIVCYKDGEVLNEIVLEEK